MGGGHFFLVIGQWLCAPGWGRISTTGLTIIVNNGFAFSEELLELGLRFSGFQGKNHYKKGLKNGKLGLCRKLYLPKSD